MPETENQQKDQETVQISEPVLEQTSSQNLGNSQPSFLGMAKNKKVQWIFVVCFLIVAALACFLVFSPAPKEKIVPKPAAVVPNLNQAEMDRAVILSRQDFVFPAVVSSGTTTKQALPTALAMFLPDAAQNLQISQNKFQNNLTGYSYSYDIGGINLIHYYLSQYAIALNNKWEIPKGTRTDEFGFLEIKSDSYQSRIQFTAETNGLVHVDGTASELVQ